MSFDYLKGFGLDYVERITEIPVIWQMSGRLVEYMTFIILDLLNDQRPKVETKLSYLPTVRHISGNKTNKSSMSATVSRLKSAGVAEDHGEN